MSVSKGGHIHVRVNNICLHACSSSYVLALSSSMSAIFLYAIDNPHTASIQYTLSRIQAWLFSGLAGNRPVTGSCGKKITSMKTCSVNQHRGTKANAGSLKILKEYNNCYYSEIIWNEQNNTFRQWANMPHILNFSHSFRHWRKADINSFRIYKNRTNKFCNRKISIIEKKWQL